MQLLRVWADEAGESHLAEVDLPTRVVPAATGVPQLTIGGPLPADEVELVEVLGDGTPADWHPAPRRQLVVFVTGPVTIRTSDGDARSLPPGSAVLVEDTWGRGHVTEHPPGDQSVVQVRLRG
jgi:hypothetical protein